MALWPSDYGLHPGNMLPVQLYYQAARDQRVGMDAVLVSTLTPADVHAVLEVYSEHIPTEQDRQRVYEKIMLLDQIATDVRARREESVRDQRRK